MDFSCRTIRLKIVSTLKLIVIIQSYLGTEERHWDVLHVVGVSLVEVSFEHKLSKIHSHTSVEAKNSLTRLTDTLASASALASIRIGPNEPFAEHNHLREHVEGEAKEIEKGEGDKSRFRRELVTRCSIGNEREESNEEWCGSPK